MARGLTPASVHVSDLDEDLPPSSLDATYVAARRVLLDALTALASHRPAVIVAGAQAVYLRAGSADLAIAPYTTDGDLALDPDLLGEDPLLEAAMRAAGFELQPGVGGHVEPGVWTTTAEIQGQSIVVPVDLIVPEGAASGAGRRGARLGVHGKRAARRATGLEAALVDHTPITIAAFDPSDSRSVMAEVAGAAALFVAKAHKIQDRVQTGRADRVDDKDAADVVRLMQTTSPSEVGDTFAMLLNHEMARVPTSAGLDYLQTLFGRRGYPGVTMATRALRLSLPEEQVVALCVGYTRELMASAGVR
jgi:hypothetical protein